MNCEAYLKNRGWREAGTFGKDAKFFGKANNSGQFLEVLVPTKTDIGDYKNLIVNLLSTLQDFEDRSSDYIANDIVLAKFDIFRIIAFKGDASASLPLKDATTLLDSSLSMMTSAAQSLITKQPYFQSRYPSEVSEFVPKLRMGHTERGSFVITLQTPIAPDLGGRLPMEEVEPHIEEEPFERQVTIRLCSLIEDANAIANESDSEAFDKSMDRGMNANFFEALADITEVCGETGANMDMTWASVRPIQPIWNVKHRFVVEKEKTEILREAGRTLRTRVPETNIAVSGYVVTLHRNEGEAKGIIKLCDVTTTPERLISMELGTEFYDKAIEAHQKMAIVTMKGDLKKNVRGQTLINVSDLKITAMDDLTIVN